jgi:hypothetical protein
MSSGSLDEPVAKLDRAIEHYRVIKRDLFGGYDGQARPVTLERPRDGVRYRVRAGEIEPLPTDLPLILGDAYFNLRAAVDYLVYQRPATRLTAIPTRLAAYPHNSAAMRGLAYIGLPSRGLSPSFCDSTPLNALARQDRPALRCG